MENKMNFKIQRFQPGHPLYSEATITNNNHKLGEVGTFQSVFGQIVDDNGNIICYCQERKDTLIDCDTYNYSLYFSPANQLTVPRLVKDSAGNDISAHEYEIHPANWTYQLKGCCAPCTSIDIKTPAGDDSRAAWGKLMTLIGENGSGLVTYENLIINS